MRDRNAFLKTIFDYPLDPVPRLILRTGWRNKVSSGNQNGIGRIANSKALNKVIFSNIFG